MWALGVKIQTIYIYSPPQKTFFGYKKNLYIIMFLSFKKQAYMYVVSTFHIMNTMVSENECINSEIGCMIRYIIRCITSEISNECIVLVSNIKE